MAMQQATGFRSRNWAVPRHWLIGTAVLVAFLVVIESRYGWTSILKSWHRLSLAELSLALALVFATYALRAVRTYDYFHRDLAQRFPECLRMVVFHNFYVNVLPFRSGELAFPILMRRYFSVPVKDSVPALLWLRFLDLHFIVLVATGVLLWTRSTGLVTLPSLAVVACVPLLVLKVQRKLVDLMSRKDTRFHRTVRTILEGAPRDMGLFWRCWSWTAINWAAKLSLFAWILGRFAGSPFGVSLLGSIMGEISSTLPIHGLAGAGTYEAGVLVALLPAGVGFGEALNGAINLHLFVLGATMLGAVIAFVWGSLSGSVRSPAT